MSLVVAKLLRILDWTMQMKISDEIVDGKADVEGKKDTDGISLGTSLGAFERNAGVDSVLERVAENDGTSDGELLGIVDGIYRYRWGI